MNKTKTPILVLIAALLSVGIFGVMRPHKVQAAAAECYVVTDTTVKLGSCSGLLAPDNTFNFPNDKCYKYSAGAGPGLRATEVSCEGIRALAGPSASTTPPPGPISPPGDSYDKSTSSTVKAVEDSPLFTDYLIPLINILSGGVVAAAAVFMVVAGIQYSSGRDNPQAVAAAKARIINVIIGLLAYLFIYGFLQFVIPGGYF